MTARALAAVQESAAIEVMLLPVEVMLLPVDALVLGDDYRLDDDPEAVAELAASIAEYGLLQPLLVRPIKNGYEVVAGRRRLAASRAAGLDRVSCIVRALSNDAALDAALVENLHRRDLSPIEVALALARMRDQGLTQKVIAARIGRSAFYVSVLLRLLEMPKRIQNKVHAGTMKYTTAYDHWKRELSGRQGSTPRTRSPHADGTTLRAVNHWRRRHDRLLAGIYAVLKARPRDIPEVRMMLDRLLKLDTQALPDEADIPIGRPRSVAPADASRRGGDA